MKVLNIQPMPEICLPVAVSEKDQRDIRAWLTQQAQSLTGKPTEQQSDSGTASSSPLPVYLLAHADDGVIWGTVQEDSLLTSHEATRDTIAADVCPPLNVDTLQQARLFSEAGELLLWRVEGGNFQARLLRPVQEGETSHWDDAVEERWLLLGTTPETLADGFTLWEEGAEGMRHALPWPLSAGEKEPPCLVVRHFLAKEEATARLVASRLVTLAAP